MEKTASTTEDKKNRRIPAKETAIFCSQVAMLLKAGIPLHEGIASLGEGADAGAGARFDKLIQILEESGSLYEAVRASDLFPAYMVNMVHIGEAVGHLDAVMESLGRYYEREDALRTSIRSAVLYPAVLVLMMAAVIAVLVAEVLPVFAQVFRELGMEASQDTGSVIRFGTVAGWCVLIFVAVLLVLTMAVLLLSHTAKGGRWLLRIAGCLPGLRGIYRRIASGRFASVMAMMLSSGYDLDEALKLAPEVVNDEQMAEKIRLCRDKVAEGVPLGDALMELGLFSGLYARMIQVGVHAGQLDGVMEHLAVIYEQESDEAIGRMIALIEPTLVILLSLIIGVILLSVMLPLISILSVIG